MSQSGRLRLVDIRRTYELIGDCRDLGHDPDAWQRRMLDGLRTLTGACAASGGEGRWPRPNRPLEIIRGLELGYCEAGRRQFEQYVRENGQVDDVINLAIQRSSARLVVGTRTELVENRIWYRSPTFQEFRRVGGTDHQLSAVVQLTPDGYCVGMAVHRAIGDRDFSPRERRIMKFFASELGPLLGTALHCVFLTPFGPLPPRLREVLLALLRGQSEKEIATHLGLSRATVHEYIQALYQRFKVSSRAELMAWFLRRAWNNHETQRHPKRRPQP
jgi:DNA-binding CsgD family transcriptional regulator